VGEPAVIDAGPFVSDLALELWRRLLDAEPAVGCDLGLEIQLGERLLVAAGVGSQREMERTKGFPSD